ncbi:putative porin [Olivibacter sitiensis]|uniref:putative porin n=1 Tax=Olivibacter sitiensis TaxID=376470 RepID=UPI0004290D06|nr:putative porin [Olivibacter sitiensis]
MKVLWRFVFAFVFLFFGFHLGYAQEEEWGGELDSLRRAEEARSDSVVYTAKYIRFTTLDLMQNGTRTIPLDTTLTGIQYYNPQYYPRNPTMNLGNYGLATRDMLFQPSKEIGFRTGFTSLERYLMQSDSIRYYRARAPYSELNYVTGDQVFRAHVSQNINPHWNIGASFDVSLARGFYANQRYNDIKPVLYSWYESPNLRYNLFANLVFNKLVATENGSILDDDYFNNPEASDASSTPVKLNGQREARPRNTWTDNALFFRQSLYMGRIDTLNRGTEEQVVLPTQTVFHAFKASYKKYQFYKNEADTYGVFPLGESVLTQDSTRLYTIANDFGYSFSLRGRSVSFLRNEIKLDLAMRHELMFLRQSTPDTTRLEHRNTFQNITLKAGLGYKFSDKVALNLGLNQIMAGRNFGDFLYEATSTFQYNERLGRLIFSAYLQNQSPAMVYDYVDYTYHQWGEWGETALDKTKVTNLAAAYENERFKFLAKAEYFLVNNYTYFREVDNPNFDARLSNTIVPAQMTSPINVLKVTLSKKINIGKRWHFDNYIVYQKSDFHEVLQTPELYTWHSFYHNNLLAKVINFNLGFDVRFNTPYVAPSYAINLSQFYLPSYPSGFDPIQFSTYPVVDVWLTATLKKTNFFLRYDYANQGLLSNGYYTVRRYPMLDRSLRFGVKWNFYD